MSHKICLNGGGHLHEFGGEIVSAKASNFKGSPSNLRGPWFPGRRIAAQLAAMIVVGVLIYLVDPLGAYAQARTKAVVNIFFVTDPRPEATTNGRLIFSALPNDQRQNAEQVSYGMGRIALSWSRSDVLRNLRSEIPLVRKPEAANLQSVIAGDFFTNVGSYRAPYAHESFGEPDVLIFIHGFDNSFEGVTQAAAKLGFDLKFDGPVIAYSWPSKGQPTPIAYSYDGEQSYWSRKHLANLLTAVAGDSNHR